MSRPIPLFALAGLLLIIPAVHAQGFNSYSGRNHPELDWKVAETEHFRIMHPARLAGIAAEAAPIAEMAYDTLSANLDVTFDDKIRIYLSDQDEIGNGFAVPIGNGYTDIWVHTGTEAAGWTGRVKWLRKVLAHELAHIFHFQAVYSDWGLVDNLLGDPLPSFWTEGLAQYQTERWDALRGDQWLRTAVLDDQLSYEDGRSLRNGQLLYAVGHAQLRFFAEQYGDSTLTDLLAHRSDALFGLHEVHDFDDAFEATTDESYRAFYDDWRRHVNVYYNGLAAALETPDSLASDTSRIDPLGLPGQYLFDVKYNADTTQVALLALPSLERPVRRLYVLTRESGDAEIVADGAIQPPVSWSPDGTQLAFARRTRGEHGSLLYDLYVVDADGEDLRRLTHSRRARSPTFAPDGNRLAFIGYEGGTANLFVRDLGTGQTRQITTFTGDVQLATARWHPTRDTVAAARFRADGARDVILVGVNTGTVEAVTPGTHDDRRPLWSPDGTRLAYTSLRDNVPNAFVYHLRRDTHRRVTHVVTGATPRDWLPPDSTRPAGSLIVTSSHTKTRDRAYRIDATRSPNVRPVQVPSEYVDWTRQRPPHTLPRAIPPNADLITARYDYNSWANVTHTLSLPFPFYFGPDAWGLGGLTTWIEPLGKHLFTALGGLTVPAPRRNSFFLASYVNNQLAPSLILNGYHFPGRGRFYGSDVLVETLSGGDLTVSWPLDWFDVPYEATRFQARLRYVHLDPLNTDALDLPATTPLPPPTEGQQADVTVGLTWKQQRPYRYNTVHPLDGYGLRGQVTGAAAVLGADSEFLRGDLAGYAVLPALGKHRLYLYGRAQAQTGDPLPQDYIGFSRYDDVRVDLPSDVPFTLGDAERVRGYRRYALGTRVLFGSLEYRVPLTTSLETEVLGAVSLGATAAALFVDAGLVWSDTFDRRTERVGTGLELKNELRLGGFPITHALGVALPADEVDDVNDWDDLNLYYRVRTPLPF